MTDPTELIEIYVGGQDGYTRIEANHTCGAWLWAEHDVRKSPELLHIEELHVPEGVRRAGIASELCKAVTRSALELPQLHTVTHVSAGLTNPHMPAFIEKIVGIGIAEFFEDDEHTIRVAAAGAAQLIADRQRMAQALMNEGQDDAHLLCGVDVHVPIQAVNMLNWPRVSLD